MSVVGSAEVVIHAVTAGFSKELERGTAPAFAAVEAEAEAAGVKSGEAMAAGVRKTEAANSKAFSGLAAAGHKAFLGIGVAAVAALGESVHLAAGMQKTDAAISGVTQTSIAAGKAIGDTMLKAGTENTFGGKQLADAYATVAGQLKAVHGSALDTSQALEVMKAASALAEAKQIDLGSATKAVSSTMQAFGLDSEHAAHVSDVLFAASNATGQSVSALGTQIGRIHSRMGDVAGSLTDVSGLLVDMTNHGITGRAAMSGLTAGLTSLNSTSVNVQKAVNAQNNALSAMPPKLQTLAKSYLSGTTSQKDFHAALASLPPAQQQLAASFVSASSAVEKSQQAYKNLGVNVFDSKGKFVGMGSVIEQLEPKFKKMTQQQQLATATQIFGAGAARQMTAVINAGSAAYEKATSSVSKHGQAESAAQKQAKTLHGQLETLKNTAESLATEIGEKLIPPLTSVATHFLHATQYVLNHKAVLVALAIVVGGVLATAMTVFAVNRMVAFKDSFIKAGTSMGIFGGEMEATAATTVAAGETMDAAAIETAATVDTAMGATGIGAILIGVGLAVTLLATHWKQVTTAIGNAAKDMVDFIKKHWRLIAEILLAPIAPVISAYLAFHKQIDSVFTSVFNFIKGTWDKVSHATIGVVDDIVGFFTKLPGRVVKVVSGVVGEMYNVGKNIVLGLIHGVGSMVGSLIDTVKHLASSVLDTIKGPLGFLLGSPSKITHQYGRWVVQGFQEGFDEQTAQVHMQTPMGKMTFNARAASSGGGGGGGVAQEIMRYFTSRGLSPAGAAGIVGNLTQESNLNPKSPGGYIAQWQGSRMTQLEAYAKQQGKPVTDLGVQLGFILKELTTGYKGAYSAVKNAKDPRAAAVAFSNLYEHPLASAANLPHRQAAAAAALAGFHGAKGSTGGSSDPKHKESLAQEKKALDKWITAHQQALNKLTRAETESVAKGTQAEKDAMKDKIAGQRAALAQEIKDRRGALAAGLSAEKAQQVQRTKDAKAGNAALNKLQEATLHGSLTSLNTQLDSVHEKALAKLKTQLHDDHTKALDKLVKSITAAHTAALKQQAKLQKEANDKEAADKAKEQDQTDATNISNAAKAATDQASATAQAISDATKIQLDRQAEVGLSGADLVAAQAQTALDVLQQQNNTAFAADQYAIDAAVGNTESFKAAAAAKLAVDQGNAQIAQAQAQANLDLANAAAQAADNAANNAPPPPDPADTTPTDTTPTEQHFNFVINGGGMTANDLMGELGWALRTGVLPPPAPMAAVN